MREIKFRAWDKNNSRMIDLKKVTPLAMAANLGIDGIFIPFAEQYELMQYTGLKDKNGVEIYEGDIVRDINECIYSREPNIIIGSVDWDEVNLTYRIQRENGNFIYLCEAEDCEVVGNVYDNPELLEGRQPE